MLEPEKTLAQTVIATMRKLGPAPESQSPEILVNVKDLEAVIEEHLDEWLARDREGTPPPSTHLRGDCPECHGTGEVFGHADDCHDDLCALNGDIHSCSGKVERCGCTAPQPNMAGWMKVPDELPQELLRSINRETQVLAYENGRYYNAWFEFEPSEGGWLWTDEADSDPDPSHYRLLSEVAFAEHKENSSFVPVQKTGTVLHPEPGTHEGRLRNALQSCIMIMQACRRICVEDELVRAHLMDAMRVAQTALTPSPQPREVGE